MLRTRQFPPVSVQHAADAAPGHLPDHHVIAAKQQLSRITLRFQDLSPDVWTQFSFQIDWHPQEQARSALDFATVGITFLTEDGSEIDFSHVPGLSRAQIDSYSIPVAGPALHDRNRSPSGSCQFNCTFLTPAPARHLLINIRSGRNSHSFQIGAPGITQFTHSRPSEAGAESSVLTASAEETDFASRMRTGWISLSNEPTWFGFGLVSGRRMIVRGQMITEVAGGEGALVRVIYRDSTGRPVDPPYADTTIAPDIGAFISIPTLTQARRFTLDLSPPTGATRVELGFQARGGEASVRLLTPFELMLDESLLLESISGETTGDAADFPDAVARSLELFPSDLTRALSDRDSLAARPRIHEQLRHLQFGEQTPGSFGDISLVGYPLWTVPDQPTWAEDPFQSPAWRMEYQSLWWLKNAAGDGNSEVARRAFDLALAWSRSNAWGQPADSLSLHPSSLAARAELLLDLLAIAVEPDRRRNPETVRRLIGEILRHGFVLSEIVGQNVFSHSVYSLHASSALLALALALPELPLALYWRSAALSRLETEFHGAIHDDGSADANSLHERLQALSLGLILHKGLEPVQEAQHLREHLLPRLREATLALVAVTDHRGMLPALGDSPHGFHHAGWMTRLLSEYGRSWIVDEPTRDRLFPRNGTRLHLLPQSGLIAARRFQDGRVVGHFCATLSGQPTQQDHSDCTSFVFTSQGEPWIVDAGGSGQSETGVLRHFLTSPRAHNIAVPDGRDPTAGAAWIASSIRVENTDVIELGSNVHGPDYEHRRILVVLDNLRALAVYDWFRKGGHPVAFEGLLHFDPKVVAALVSTQRVMGYRGDRRLQVTMAPVSGRFTGSDLTLGRSDNLRGFQGFVSRRPGALDPATVLSYRYAGTGLVCGGVVMATDEESHSAISAAIASSEVQDLLLPADSR